MAAEILSFTLEDLKRQAEEFGLEGKEKAKFLRDEWRRIVDLQVAEKAAEREAMREAAEREAKR